MAYVPDQEASVPTHVPARQRRRAGLPFLDAMVPAATALADTAAAPKTRAGFFYIPHGAIMNNTPFGKEVDAWTSSGKGADFKLGHTVAPLEPLKNYVTTFENLENLAAGGSVHTLNPATWLSCVRPDTAAKGASMAITLDQVIAQNLGQKTALPSLEVASETTIQVAACGGAGCYYASTTSYSGAHLAAADGVQPAQGVHPAHGRGRHGGRTRGAAAQELQHPRHGLRARQGVEQ